MFPAGALFKSKTTPNQNNSASYGSQNGSQNNQSCEFKTDQSCTSKTNKFCSPKTNPTCASKTDQSCASKTDHMIPRSTNSVLPRPTNPARHILPTAPRVIIPENVPTGKENVKPTSYYERKEFKRQKRLQNAKIHVSI